MRMSNTEVGRVKNFTLALLKLFKLLTALSVLPLERPLTRIHTMNTDRNKPGPWPSTLARTKGHRFHIQLCRWKELELHHVPGYDGTSVTHIEANVVGGYVFCSRHRSTNSSGCITSPLNLNKWHCSYLDHCLFCIWRRSPIEALSSRLTMAEGCHMGQHARHFHNQRRSSPATAPQSRTIGTAPAAS